MVIEKRLQKRLEDDEKLTILNSYALGVPPRTIATIIGKSVGAIKTFFCRFKLNQTLPPIEKASKTLIKGRLSALIRKTVSDTFYNIWVNLGR